VVRGGREFNSERGEIGVLDAVMRSKDPTTFTVLFEDSAALAGILIAFVGHVAGGIPASAHSRRRRIDRYRPRFGRGGYFPGAGEQRLC
jgi:hypothetical protein